MKTLSINGTDLSTFGIFIGSDTYLSAPGFDYAEYEVPARNGVVISYNRRMQNVIRRFDCFINGNVQTAMDALKNLIYSNPGYLRLETSYEADTYQEGYLAQEIEAEPFMRDNALTVQFSLYFSCKPQKFFKAAGTGRYAPAVSTRIGSLIGVFHKDDEEVAGLLARVQPKDKPSAEWWVQFNLFQRTDANFTPFTNINATNSTGGFVMLAIYEWMTEEIIDSIVTSYGIGTETLTNYEPSEETVKITVLVPFDSSMVVTGSCTDSATYTMRADLTDCTVTLTNLNAVGADVESLLFGVRAPDMDETATAVGNDFFIEGKKNGVRRFFAHVTAPFTKLTATQLNKLIEEYSVAVYSPGVDEFQITVDENLNAMVESEQAGSLIEITGDISGICDTYAITMLKGPVSGTAYAGQPLEVSATIRWWKV